MSRVLFVAVAAGAVLIARCTRPQQTVPTASGIRWTRDVLPLRPSALRPATLRLRAVDASGRAVALQGFRATTSMPEMRHRGETIAFREVDPGVFEALHTFSMDGRWEIRVTGSLKGKRAEARISVIVGGGP